MGLAIGCGAAAAWGVADCLVAIASRRVGAWAVAVGFHLVALVPLIAITVATGGVAQLHPGELVGFAGLGLVGWLAYITFYSALAIGPVSLISPIVSGYAAITVLFAVLLGDEQLSLPLAAAAGLTIAGVMLAGVDARARLSRAFGVGALRGLALGLIAMVLFGGFVYGVSYPRPGISWLAAICLARGFSCLFLLLGRGQRVALPPSLGRTTLGLIGLIGVLDTVGYVCFAVGIRQAQTAVVATASAPYAVVPVVVGVSLLNERLSSVQWLGLSVVGLGLVMLGLAS